MRNKGLILGLGGTIVCTLVLIGAVMFGRSPDRKQEPAVLSAEKMVRFPQTLVELNAWYVEPSAGENAATFYSRGLDALQNGKVGTPDLPLLDKSQLPPLGTPMPTPVKSALAALANSNRNALQFFNQAAKYDRCRYPVDLSLGYEALFPHVPKLKNAALLVELCAIFHAEANQAEEAANDVLLCWAWRIRSRTNPRCFRN